MVHFVKPVIMSLYGIIADFDKRNIIYLAPLGTKRPSLPPEAVVSHGHQ